MGEYGKYMGRQIKIGTCEDMYYLRYDQIGLVESDTLRDLTNLRFRFPFPDEDGRVPGEFEDYDRGLTVWGIEPPDEIEHYNVQFKADAGILASLPCPYSTAAKGSGVKYHFNGYRGPVKITQQRIWAGVLVLVADCGACGAKYRMPTLEQAQPVLDALERHAVGVERDGSPGRAQMYRTVAERIVAGYSQQVGRDLD